LTASLLLLAAAGCVSGDGPSSSWRSRSDRAPTGGVMDIPAAPAADPPKTLDEHSSNGLAFLAEIADAILHGGR
jgi:hypothetical protein